MVGNSKFDEVTTVRDGMREQVLGTLPKPSALDPDPLADTINVPVIPTQNVAAPVADELDIPDFLK